MSFQFNAEEILNMAEEIEKNGADFYRRTAQGVQDRSLKDILLELAAMEDEHRAVFSSMKSALSGREKETVTFDPAGETALYLTSLADTRVFFRKDIDTSSLEGILKAAILAEKDSIAFYLGLKDLIPPTLGQEKLEKIIKEEMAHIRILSGRLASFGKPRK